jgi:hypothetical protein
MKNILLLFALIIFSSYSVDAQKSPRLQTEGEIFGTNIKIDYGAPSVRDRVIWGGLVSYDVVWRAGANKNTTVSFDKDVIIGGQELPAGNYGFFIIPKEKGDWVAIFNKKNEDWGSSSYDQKQDALRLNIKPDLVDANQEQLNYSLTTNSIIMVWEKVKLSIPIEEK